jgi:rhodanese-related sulfurtransferase
MLIADVRSHGYYDADSERIAGSIRIEPNNLIEEVKNFPRIARFISTVLEQREATSARVARQLQDLGFKVYVIAGGLRAWRKAGNPVERVPHDDLLKLPTFN